MKLIDLLVQELPKRGGWPEGAVCVVQSVVDGEIYFYNRPYDGNGCMPKMKGKILLPISDDVITGFDGLNPVITRAQYEASLSASQKGEWDGAGLPPVGIEVESAQPGQINWTGFKVIAVDSGAVFGFWSNGVASALDGDRWLFRHIRSEADKKREAALDAILSVFSGNAATGTAAALKAIYDAIAAGKIPGVKLED